MSAQAVDVDNVVMQFGGLRAVDGVSLRVGVGERRVLLGPNGAGKTTLFNMIGGQLQPTSGAVRLFGQDVSRQNPYRRAHDGLARTFQITSLFPDMTVGENLHLAVRALSASRFGMIRPASQYPRIAERVADVLAEWRFPAGADTLVSNLSYGDQRKLELAMAVANRPRILLLDEPTSGLSATETESVVGLIKGLPEDVTVIVVEHDMDVAFAVADLFTILHNGRLVTTGTAAEVQANEDIQRIYFGEGE
ncbi:ATP-binding cassette domain-containing protein [Nitratireductor sp. CAU 1489]|uniref:ATP-binding cassette domain-containing protein n=1 Tax=Nitratireductor arenosus TaxID=2682096 RepID=A0A844QHQ7_9HYPH|nr:ABC transporter ATP-binding protein [Nitratireductor arenosus]MVA99002.1 ATP-binding cassette domain-containing protein [Nitratireductor arenosus]